MGSLTREEAFYAFYYAMCKSRRMHNLLCATVEWHFRDSIGGYDRTYFGCRPLTNFSRHHSPIQAICKLLDLFQRALKHPLLVKVVPEDEWREAHDAAEQLRSVLLTGRGAERTRVDTDALVQSVSTLFIHGDAPEWWALNMAFRFLGPAGAYWFDRADKQGGVWRGQGDDWWAGLDPTAYRRCDPDKAAAILLQPYRTESEANQAADDEARDRWCYEQRPL